MIKSKFTNNEVKIEEDLNRFYIVCIWQYGWETISRHKLKKDAEVIEEMILSGKKPEQIKKVIDVQNKRAFSRWIAPHWITW